MTITDQEKILNFLKFTGPTTPSRISKNIKQELLFTSAHLSDLRAQGKIKISNLKIGGSPLYYLPGQEDQLYQNAPGNINPKDLEILNLLREKKILVEASLDLLGRVAIRNLKDFAIPLHVTLDGKIGLFWKWHLLTTEEANKIIEEMITKLLNKNQPQKPAIIPPPIQEFKEDIKLNNEPVVQPIFEQKQILDNEIKIKKEIKPVEKTIKKIIKKEEQKKIKETESEIKNEDNKREEIKVLLSEMKETKDQKVLKKTDIKITPPEQKMSAFQDQKENKINKIENVNLENNKIIKRKEDKEDVLLLVDHFFNTLKIIIDQKETIRKNAEFNLLVNVPSVVGSVKYFCKVKKKAKCDEKDLSAAYVEAQMKKLPLLFVYSNEITKKVEEILNSGTLENAIAKKLE